MNVAKLRVTTWYKVEFSAKQTDVEPNSALDLATGITEENSMLPLSEKLKVAGVASAFVKLG